jgi:hypothetical protein
MFDFWYHDVASLDDAVLAQRHDIRLKKKKISTVSICSKLTLLIVKKFKIKTS